MARTTFLFKKDFITEDDKELFSLEELGSLIVAWADFINKGEAPAFRDRALKLKFNAWKEFYLDSEAEYARIVEKRAEAGRKSAEARANNSQHVSTNVNTRDPNANANANANAIKKEIYKEKDGAKAPASPRMTRPTLLEVKDYIQAKGYLVSAEQWYDFYEANGWKVGRNPMKDWKACIRSWEQRERKEQANRPKTHHEEFMEIYQRLEQQEAEHDPTRDNDPFRLLV